VQLDSLRRLRYHNDTRKNVIMAQISETSRIGNWASKISSIMQARVKPEIILAALIPLLSYALGSLNHEDIKMDQISIALLVMVLVLFWFISRRIHELNSEMKQRRLMGIEINRYTVELEEKVSALNAANEKLQEIDKIKDTFLSTVSHEFRTPLASIKAYVDILLTYDNDEEIQKEFLGTINNETDRLARLINDFLDLSKIEAGRIQWETASVEMPEVIKAAIEATEALAKNTDLALNTKIEPDLSSVWSDKDRCLQVVTNLISNAIKFTPEGGNIFIRAINSSESPGMVQVSVTDTGMGIPLEEQERIFHKFTQVGDGLKDKPPGTGLGLAICQKIVEYYGGSIWVESEPGSGSTFSFTMPVVKQPENDLTFA